MDNSKLFRVLSIDGGGIRGILPGQILVNLEQKLQKRTKNPNARLADFFDLFAGTSTGGILTIIYLTPDENGRPKYSAQDAVDLYLKHGSAIFGIPFWHKLRSFFGLADEKYPADFMEKMLKEKLGDTTLSGLVEGTNCLITSFDVSNGQAKFFTSSDAKEKPDRDFYLRDVARSTSAAPTYFQAAKVRSTDGGESGFIDGGVFANNPSMCALVEAYKMKLGEGDRRPKAEDIFMLSIGTSNSKNRYDINKIQGFGQLEWIIPVIDIMMSGVADTIAYQVKKLYQLVEMQNPHKKNQYIRINPSVGKANGRMDNASPKNLELLKEAGDAAAKEFDEQLELAVDKLLQGRFA